ncbi:MAG TPA: hypothetical protein VGG31_05130 [Candidatus Dormibacteraeota bacterium]|jgi:hypothetical protein
MNRVRTAVMAAAVAGSLLVGGVGGAVLYGMTVLPAAAATNPTPTPAAGTAPGKFVSNETAAHEATESAAREAQENAGQVPTVP